jgi:hypothetical protein
VVVDDSGDAAPTKALGKVSHPVGDFGVVAEVDAVDCEPVRQPVDYRERWPEGVENALDCGASGVVQGLVGTDVVKSPVDCVGVDAQRDEPVHGSSCLVLEVDVERVLARSDSLFGGEHRQPALCALGLAREQVDLARVQQALAVGAAQHLRRGLGIGVTLQGQS